MIVVMSISNNLLSAFVRGVATYKEMKDVIDAVQTDDGLLDVLDIIEDIDQSDEIDDIRDEFNEPIDSFDDFNENQLNIK